jgi:hypothetical protein
MRLHVFVVDDDNRRVEVASNALVRAAGRALSENDDAPGGGTMGEAFRSPLPGLASGLASEPSALIRRHITNAPKLISVNP